MINSKFLRDKIDYLKQAKIQEEKEINELDNIIKLVFSEQYYDLNRVKRNKNLIVYIK